MTENKRFTLREPKVDGDISCSEIADNGEWITYGEIVDLLNENELLKEIIKVSCVMEICESCRFGKYWITGDYWTATKDLEFKCLKGHPAVECCEIMECKDYEIKDLKELLEWVKR